MRGNIWTHKFTERGGKFVVAINEYDELPSAGQHSIPSRKMCAAIDFLIDHTESGVIGNATANHIKSVIRAGIVDNDYFILRTLLVFQAVQARFDI